MQQNKKVQFLKLTIFFLISLLLMQWIFPPKKEITNEEKTQQIEKKVEVIRNPISFQNKFLKGEFDINNARLDSVLLKDIYKTSKKEENISLINNDFFVEFGFLGDEKIKSSTAKKWKKISSDSNQIILQQIVKNLKYEIKFLTKDNHILSVEQRVKNTGSNAEKVWAYGRLVNKTIPNSGYVHQGWTGYLGGDFTDYDIDDLQEQNEKIANATGWFGWTNHYTQTILKTDAIAPTVNFSATEIESQADFQTKEIILNSGDSKTVFTKIYAGPKQENVLLIAEKEGFEFLSKSIDYGWLFVISKPLAQGLHWLGKLLGNMGWAIILLTLLIRLALYPLSKKSLVAMAKMKDLQPKIKALQAKFASNKIKLQQEMMKLYKTNKVSPAGGCVPMLLQVPIFFALYRVLMVSFDLRQAGFLYIKDLSQADPTSLFNLFGAIPFAVPEWLPAVGILPILMGLAMWVQQKIQGTTSTAPKNKIMSYLPIIFVLMFGGLPAGLVLYWMMSNVFSLAQTYIIQRNMD
ncbi:MAG: membrane protein insertase YidC [Alphaproteobacteria bacterium]|nr:MAG: membrane protein insertase YidC [Rickettsiaceae bacterium 4572_127]